MSVVLDASAVLAWLLPDEQTPKALKLLDDVAETGAHAPLLMMHEIANALVMAIRRKRISEADMFVLAAQVLALPIALDDESATGALTEGAALAVRRGVSAYDAAYLGLALREGLPLATRDSRLAAAAQAEGVSLVDLGPPS